MGSYPQETSTRAFVFHKPTGNAAKRSEFAPRIATRMATGMALGAGHH